MKTCLIKPPTIRPTIINASAASPPCVAYPGALVSAGPEISIIDAPGQVLVEAAQTTAE